MRPQNIVGVFKATGLFHLNSDTIPDTAFVHSLPTDQVMLDEILGDNNGEAERISSNGTWCDFFRKAMMIH